MLNYTPLEKWFRICLTVDIHDNHGRNIGYTALVTLKMICFQLVWVVDSIPVDHVT